MSNQLPDDGASGLENQGLPDPAIGILLPQTPGQPRKVTDALGIEHWESALDNDTFLGSSSGAKTTLDFPPLWPTTQNRLQVHDPCEATEIRSLNNAGAGPRYEVRYRDHKRGGMRSHRARATPSLLLAPSTRCACSCTAAIRPVDSPACPAWGMALAATATSWASGRSAAPPRPKRPYF